MLKKRFFLLLLLLIYINSSYLFSDIFEARTAYNNGHIKESIDLYNDWLQLNHESNDFTSILFELTQLNGDIILITTILEEQIEFVNDRNKKKDLLIFIAQLYELSSDLHNAQINYQNAALISLNKIDYTLLLKSAELLLLKGDVFLAESQLKEVITNTSNKNILFEAELFYEILNILHSGNNFNTDLSSLDTPESLYIYYILAKTNSEQFKMDSIKEQILKDFESSPEYALLKNKIFELPDILSSLGLLTNNTEMTSTIIIDEFTKHLPENNFMIQAGSFKDEENAHYLSKDINTAGFKSLVEKQIINNMAYFKVLLYFSTEPQMISALKELQLKGFEGFPVY